MVDDEDLEDDDGVKVVEKVALMEDEDAISDGTHGPNPSLSHIERVVAAAKVPEMPTTAEMADIDHKDKGLETRGRCRLTHWWLVWLTKGRSSKTGGSCCM